MRARTLHSRQPHPTPRTSCTEWIRDLICSTHSQSRYLVKVTSQLPSRRLVKLCTAAGLIAAAGVFGRMHWQGRGLGLAPFSGAVDSPTTAGSAHVGAMPIGTAFAANTKRPRIDRLILQQAAELQRRCNDGERNACRELGLACQAGMIYPPAQIAPDLCQPSPLQRGCELGDWRACDRGSPGARPPQGQLVLWIGAACDDDDEEACTTLAEQGGKYDPAAAAAMRRRAEMLKGCARGCADVPKWRTFLPEERARRERLNAEKYAADCTLGIAASCWRLAYVYARGVGVAQNGERAREADERALRIIDEECTNPSARCNVFDMKGLLRRCIDGDPGSCFRAGSFYGSFYREGDRLVALRLRAHQMDETACERGQGAGCLSAGRNYLGREGGKLIPNDILEDIPRGVDLIDLGCQYGYARSCLELSSLVTSGILGIPRDDARAERAGRRYASLLWQECDRGDWTECYWLSVAYQKGTGVPKNDALAKKYQRRSKALVPSVANVRGGTLGGEESRNQALFSARSHLASPEDPTLSDAPAKDLEWSVGVAAQPAKH